MRLIDADELVNDINNGLWDWDEVQNITGVTVLKQMISDIQNTKTVDAVPVIRCEDCVHRRKDDGFCKAMNGFCGDESFFCASGIREGE